MVATTEDWEGNEVISEGDLRTYLEEGTTGDDDKDNICLDQVLEAECVTYRRRWNRNHYKVEYYAVGEEFESQ